MDISNPFGDVMRGARGRLLAALVELESAESVRALGRRARVSPQGALRLVNDFRESGLVDVERIGSSNVVSFNRDHLAAEPLGALVRLRARLIEAVAGQVRTFPGLVGAWLIGPVARGEGSRHATVDVVLIAEGSIEDEDWLQAKAELLYRVQRWTGNPALVAEHSRESFAELFEGGTAVGEELLAYGIPLTRDPPPLPSL